MRFFTSTSAVTVSLFTLLLLTPAFAHAQKQSSRGLVTAEDIAKYPNDPIERIIARKVPGVDVVRAPNGGNMLRLRGAMTLPDGQSGAQVDRPMLYVIDGVPVRTSDGSLPPIEAEDLESIRVLKGPETAVWGIEGSDGVIVFTTKRGKPHSN
jgi:outer membrane receptor for ferrienterochelin and colicin